MVTLNKNFYRGLQLIYFLCKALFLLLFRLIFYVIILKFCSIFFDLFYFYFYDNINKFSIENDFIMFQLYVYCENELSYFYNLIDLFIYIFLIYIFFQELPYESREDYNFEQYLIIPKYVRRRLTYLDVLKRNPKKYANWLKKEKIRNY
jgi:hypothetical protein